MANPTEGYAMMFEMVEHPWNGCVLIFNDGQAKLYKHRLCPDRPVLVQVEGLEPTPRADRGMPIPLGTSL